MEKEFSINLGDKVWLMHNDGVVCGSIVKLFYVKRISCIDFKTVSDNELYSVSVGGKTIGDYDKNQLFETKEGLIKSL